MITLEQTTEMMNSPEYQERFKAEYLQLKIRMIKLRKMLVKLEAGKLEFEPTCPKDLLWQQYDEMDKYAHILEVRAVLEGIELEEV